MASHVDEFDGRSTPMIDPLLADKFVHDPIHGSVALALAPAQQRQRETPRAASRKKREMHTRTNQHADVAVFLVCLLLCADKSPWSRCFSRSASEAHRIGIASAPHGGSRQLHTAISLTINVASSFLSSSPQIMDTPQFQRLRDLKQLGCAYLVFPGASHNRFEHSIGQEEHSVEKTYARTLVLRLTRSSLLPAPPPSAPGVAHLSAQMMDHLASSQPELSITAHDILLVKIAGLCHDLGHGPFSHMFEEFVHLANPTSSFSHEKMSLQMLESIVAEYNIDINDTDMQFLRECINPYDNKT